jgi:hypothetical protein
MQAPTLNGNFPGRPRVCSAQHYAQPTAEVEPTPHIDLRGFCRAPEPHLQRGGAAAQAPQKHFVLLFFANIRLEFRIKTTEFLT